MAVAQPISAAVRPASPSDTDDLTALAAAVGVLRTSPLLALLPLPSGYRAQTFEDGDDACPLCGSWLCNGSC